MLNPGPQTLKVFFQNVQGLVPFSNLKNTHPILDRTKMFELNTYIHNEKPDIVILNETWLKKSISSSEIFDNNIYDIYRNDRSNLSHPVDTNNPCKFRKNGGGVLIAIRSDLEVAPKRINLRNGAEILGIEITLGGSKFVFCTCYRVGTLGSTNHESISDSLCSFYKAKKPKKIFVVGDFNLSTVEWLSDNSPTTDNTEKLFIDTFNELDLTQCISGPTHVKGRTLDILLTNHRELINNIHIAEHNSVCKSDHFPITFEIKTKIKRKKPTKRKSYNFKRADWEALNRDLNGVDWHALLDSTEIELAWLKFKAKLFHLVYIHIPTLTLKSDFQPPWFDAELYQCCRTKERARMKFKRSNNKIDELKFINSRREFKSMASKKMRDNMYNSDDPALITKKFWSHYKFASNSHRIPECMYRNSCFRNTSIDKTNLFNNFFCDQFSDSSLYDIPIDFSNDAQFDITFCQRNIEKLLSKINSNKASGPDGIHGQIL